MKILKEIPEAPLSLSKPVVLTIGNFDGLHLGHRAILYRMKYLTREGGSTCVITFKNNPKRVLYPNQDIKNLVSVDYKLKLLKRFNVDITILLEFNAGLASIAYDQFLNKLFASIPFSHLILGEKASFGKNKEGNASTLKTLGNTLGFKAEFVQKLCNAGEEISSRRIRNLIEKGALKEAETLLGRPYSLYIPIKESFTDKKIRIEEPNICNLPEGVYAISGSSPGIAVVNGIGKLDIFLKETIELEMENMLEISFLEKVFIPKENIEEGLKIASRLIANSSWNFR